MSEDATVVHCKQAAYGQYIGRGAEVEGGTPDGIADTHSMANTPIGERGWLGNPYTKEEYGRDRCIKLFEADFRERIEHDEEFREAVDALAGAVLGGWCAPKACHGDVIAAYLGATSDEVDR